MQFLYQTGNSREMLLPSPLRTVVLIRESETAERTERPPMIAAIRGPRHLHALDFRRLGPINEKYLRFMQSALVELRIQRKNQVQTTPREDQNDNEDSRRRRFHHHGNEPQDHSHHEWI